MLKIKQTYELSSPTGDYSFGYYAENKWLSDSRIAVLFGKDLLAAGDNELIIYDIRTRESRTVARGISYFTDFLVFGNAIYYIINGTLFSYDEDTCQVKSLFSQDGIGSPHITEDGRYISVFSCSDEVCRFYRVDTEAGEGELLFERSFGKPHPIANHGMISPTDENILFFAHEGDTRSVYDRLWIFDKRDGTVRNIAPQEVDAEGLPVDCFGHEAWAHDGRGLYFVKFRESRTDSGICYADIEGDSAQLLYTGYDYWHVGASASGKYLTADTRNLGGDRSGVVLIDIKTGEETLVDTPAVTFRHPCHPHPQLSPCDTRLAYHFKNEHGNTAVKILSII